MFAFSSLLSLDLITLWRCFEFILLFSFPLFIQERGSVRLIKFYLVQVFSSILILYFIIGVNFFFFFFFSLLLKLGLPPFQNWAIVFSKHLNYWSIFVFTTFFKFPGLRVLFSFLNGWGVSNLFCNFLALISVILLINENNFKCVLFISSLNHNAWMLIGTEEAAFSYLCNYTWISFLFYLLISGKTRRSSLLGIPRLIIFLGLGGMPPIRGFFLKLEILELGCYSWLVFFRRLVSLVLYFKNLTKLNMIERSNNFYFLFLVFSGPWVLVF